jgi:hypothetical protein
MQKAGEAGHSWVLNRRYANFREFIFHKFRLLKQRLVRLLAGSGSVVRAKRPDRP